MRVRRLITVGIVAAAAVAAPAVAQATIMIQIMPPMQMHAQGVASNWTASWNEGGVDGYFYYGDGTNTHFQNAGSSRTFSHTFSTCTGGTYAEYMTATNGTGDSGMSDTVHATQAKGNSC